MAIHYIPKFQEFIGLSGDDKSVISTDGSIIYYTDTKAREVYNNGAWTEYILNTSATLNAGDIQLGAVEIKDGYSDNRAAVDINGSLYVASTPINVTFHEASSTPTVGESFTVGNFKTVRVQVTGTSSTRTIAFKGVVAEGTAVALGGFRNGDFTLATSTTANGEVWEFDVSAYQFVYMDLTAVAGGNVTIKGHAIT